MILAERRDPLALADRRDAGRRRHRGGLGERDQHVPGPRHRRDHAAHPQRPLPATRRAPNRRSRSGSCWARLVLLPRLTVNVLAATLSLAAIAFYVFVYTMWLKRSTRAEHRDRRRGRRGARARRVGGGDRLPGGAGVDPVRDRVRVDAAALLGARDAVRGGLRGGGRADAAGGQGRGRDPASDPPVLPGAVRDDPGALPVGGMGPVYSAAAVLLGGHVRLPGVGAVAEPRRERSGGCSGSRSSTSRRCSARSRSTPCCGAARARRRARRRSSP